LNSNEKRSCTKEVKLIKSQRKEGIRGSPLNCCRGGMGMGIGGREKEGDEDE
jgi:hypothetical protein